MTTVRRFVQGAISAEPATAILSGAQLSDDGPTDYIDGTASIPAAGQHSRRPIGWWLGAVAIAGVLCTGILYWSLTRPASTSAVPLRRFELKLHAESATNWNDSAAVISPDGLRLAYNCRERNAVSICVRDLDSLEVRRIVEGRDATTWFFSPDGEWLAEAIIGRFRKISKTQYVIPSFVATVYGAIGEKDKAVAELEKSIELKDS